ncbi:ABC transporter permease [Microbacterium pseudoresistens]|uniref:ABC-type nitrate/sulfonate/bicarbonate transport system permease component n=1 Tax=Microbacterium pseudoresistens TaxID=640634 RepID=A0A7Y9EW42_9MICO|nr:ABC transporter permease [Microbacterium pseudoresistens]NYD54904.1 ABC-type nitrate/sulfonate/bicarbonate transport system permease component [Microbacterium pseudoresistens]
MTTRTWRTRLLYALGLPVVLVALWWFASSASTNYFWPSLQTILSAFPDTWIGQGRVVGDVVPSLVRLLIGYAIALVLGIAIGTLVGSFRTLRELLEPLFDFFRALPPPVLIPVLMILIGIGDTMRVVVIALGCLWPVLINTVEGVRQVDEIQRATASVYQLPALMRLRRLTLPAAAPLIFAGARQALSIGIILMVISEMFASTNGIGFAIQQFQRTFSVPEMWTGVILLGVVGVILAWLFRLVETRVLAWYTSIHEAHRDN